MCLELMDKGLDAKRGDMSKTIKISDNAHRALEFAKLYGGIQIGKYASIAIIEAIQREHPQAYGALKEHATKTEDE